MSAEKGLIPEETKKLIDSMSYREMLSRWRFAKVGDPMFQGVVGDYYAEVMARKRTEIGDEKHSKISKEIGWR